MAKLQIGLSLVLAGSLAAAAGWTAPRGLEAANLLAVQDDPPGLADLGLADAFDAPTAAREIDSALAADDAELAQSFVELARERGIAVDPARAAQVEAASAAAASTRHTVISFARGLVTGVSDDLAGLAGTAFGDLLVFGDIRDAVREGAHAVRGEETNELLLGLSVGGLVITGATYATVGLAAPARAGISVIKAAGRSGRIGARLARAIRFEKPAALAELAGDVGRVGSKAGTRAALDGLRLAEGPRDVTRLAQLAAAKGGKTRAVLKLLGRGAIVLTRTAFELALGVFWAIANLIGFCASLKRMAERTTLGIIRARKARRHARALRAMAAADIAA